MLTRALNIIKELGAAKQLANKDSLWVLKLRLLIRTLWLNCHDILGFLGLGLLFATSTCRQAVFEAHFTCYHVTPETNPSPCYRHNNQYCSASPWKCPQRPGSRYGRSDLPFFGREQLCCDDRFYVSDLPFFGREQLFCDDRFYVSYLPYFGREQLCCECSDYIGCRCTCYD